jgi:hypothetical protein
MCWVVFHTYVSRWRYPCRTKCVEILRQLYAQHRHCHTTPPPHHSPPPHHHHHHVCRGHQIFSSKAMSRGSFGYWALIVFVGTIITTAIVVMIALVIFESYRAFKFANLYDDIRWVACMCLRGTVSTVHRYLDFRL